MGSKYSRVASSANLPIHLILFIGSICTISERTIHVNRHPIFIVDKSLSVVMIFGMFLSDLFSFIFISLLVFKNTP